MSQCGRSGTRPGACISIGRMTPACRSLGWMTPMGRGAPTLLHPLARARRRWRLSGPSRRQALAHRPKTPGRQANDRPLLARREGWFVETGAPFREWGSPGPEACCCGPSSWLQWQCCCYYISEHRESTWSPLEPKPAAKRSTAAIGVGGSSGGAAGTASAGAGKAPGAPQTRSRQPRGPPR
jgi:hypothetical protein